MSIQYVTGNLLNSDAQALVNTVNCVGVMGKGIALQFKEQFPNNFEQYKIACSNNTITPGQLFCTYDYPTKKTIINFPTKQHWQNPSKLEWIETGLQSLRELLLNMKMSIALPPIGCGNGGLDWKNQVQPLVHKYLDDLDTDIYMYTKEPPEQNTPNLDGLRILVTGGREFNNYSALALALTNLNPIEIIHGAAKGADTFAQKYALAHSITESKHPAQWEKHGKQAGFIRNEQMLLNSSPDIVLAFPGNTGTEHMKNIAHKHGYPVIMSNNTGQLTFDTRIHNMRTSQKYLP